MPTIACLRVIPAPRSFPGTASCRRYQTISHPLGLRGNVMPVTDDRFLTMRARPASGIAWGEEIPQGTPSHDAGVRSRVLRAGFTQV